MKLILILLYTFGNVKHLFLENQCRKYSGYKKQIINMQHEMKLFYMCVDYNM